MSEGNYPEKPLTVVKANRILVDGQEFTDTVFIDCEMVFAALEGTSFSNCRFDHCQWVFDGPAARALALLVALHRTPGFLDVFQKTFTGYDIRPKII